MTRFRAYYSDSDDDSFSDDVLEVEEIQTSEPGSSLHQDERPSRRGTGTVDSDMYTDDDGAEDKEPASRGSSTSPPPVNNRPSDPTLIPWARELGVDGQKMHAGETLLFGSGYPVIYKLSINRIRIAQGSKS